MLTIQEVGSQILTKHPGKFYVFLGSEYGIKSTYINMIKDTYGKLINVDKVSEVLQLMRTKRLIPLQPAVYVVRYDADFLKAVDGSTAASIDSTNIIGTVVCIYEDPKCIDKFDKYLPQHSVIIPEVTKDHLVKYLRRDFPELSDRFIHVAVQYGVNYGHCQQICRALLHAPVGVLEDMTDVDIGSLFGCTDAITEAQLKVGVASRNFKYVINLLDKFEDDLSVVLYAILSVMLELEKISVSRYVDSPYKSYKDRWTIPDIYNMFDQTYEQLRNSRSLSSLDMYNAVVYVLSLLNYSVIPQVGALK